MSNEINWSIKHVTTAEEVSSVHSKIINVLMRSSFFYCKWQMIVSKAMIENPTIDEQQFSTQGI